MIASELAGTMLASALLGTKHIIVYVIVLIALVGGVWYLTMGRGRA
ncbi:MAG TPA: hypothetical protein VGL20_10115 [Candidatus Dormibacteraeota bacterium]